MSVKQRPFGILPSGEEVVCYTIENANGVSVEILNYGGIVKSICVPDKDGKLTDVVLGRDTLEEYLDNYGYYGAAIGRYANRIAGGEFEIDSHIYHVGVNEGRNSLHGGVRGFDKHLFEAEANDNLNAVLMKLTSPDGDEGFPGNMRVIITYSLDDDNAFMISYKAVTDKTTVCNLTNHSYFNLAGHGSGTVYDQTLMLNCDFFTPNNDECMPTGEVLSVKNTPFDFTEGKLLGEGICGDHEQIEMFGGIDHNFAIRGRGWRLGARAACPANGITMEMYTDQTAVQLYTMNGAQEGRVCKDGVIYGVHNAFCLETQSFPNAMAYSHFIPPILKPGEIYDYTTEYKFII